MKKHLLLICYSFILSILSQNISAQNPTWMEVAPGVWKTVVGIPDKMKLPAASSGVSKSQPNKTNLAASCGELTPKEIRPF